MFKIGTFIYYTLPFRVLVYGTHRTAMSETRELGKYIEPWHTFLFLTVTLLNGSVQLLCKICESVTHFVTDNALSTTIIVCHSIIKENAANFQTPDKCILFLQYM